MNNNQRKEQAAKTFVHKANLKHKNKYDYSKVNYEGCKTKIEIVCPIHSSFFQTPNGHLTGHSCPECKREDIKTTNLLRTNREAETHRATFLTKAEDVHGNKYDYSNVIYKNRHTPIQIICDVHGEYEQLPSNHLSGNGCPRCGVDGLTGGYHKDLFDMRPDLKDRLGYLYMAKIRDLKQTNSPIFLKIGITVQTPKYRLSQIKSGNFEILELDHVEGKLFDIFTVEQGILAELKEYRFFPIRQFAGYTECFQLNGLSKIQEHVQVLL